MFCGGAPNEAWSQQDKVVAAERAGVRAIIYEWVKGCSNTAFGGHPLDCEKCTLGALSAIAAAVGTTVPPCDEAKGRWDKAVAAERERLLDRLRNPDEATCRDVLDAIAAGDPDGWVDEYNNCTVQIDGSFDMPTICRALARTLTEGQEGESKDG